MRLQADHVNRTLVPAFYRYLQAQESEAQVSGAQEYVAALEGLAALLERAERESDDVRVCGLWRHDGELGLADAMAGPCALLCSLVSEDLKV